MNRSSTASHRDEVGAMKSCHEVDARRLSIGTSEKPTRQDRHACTFLLTVLHPAQTSQDETSSNFIRWEPESSMGVGTSLTFAKLLGTPIIFS